MPFTNIFKSRFDAKITPAKGEEEEDTSSLRSEDAPPLEMTVVKLHRLFKLYGGQRHPKIGTYADFEAYGELTEWRYVPHGSTIIYISHEWVGTDHSDPDGSQMYHLLLLLERLQKGDISRTDMDAFHSLLYKHNYTTTTEEWKRILNSEKTFIWYDGFCVPRSRREEGFQSITSYIQKCDFMIILAPGCTHFDKIDPRTQRKMSLCYRTYRLRARCVFELFCAFLSTRGGEKARPALLVRSGTGNPKWISALECLKLAVGTSVFECCETNHTQIKMCLKSVVRVLLEKMIKERTESLFKVHDFALARFHKTLSVWWLRGLPRGKLDLDSVSSSTQAFRQHLHWDSVKDGMWFDRCGISIFMYAVANNNIPVLCELLDELETSDPSLRAKRLKGEVPAQGVRSLGITGRITTLVAAMGFASSEFVSLLLEHGADPYVDVQGQSLTISFISLFSLYSHTHKHLISCTSSPTL
jgi:hypothetical protein